MGQGSGKRSTVLDQCDLVAITVTLATFAVPGSFAIAADTYPSRPVRLVNPSVPGGTVDIWCRALANRLTEWLKQPAIVDNRPGAGGTIGGKVVASAPADGHTLLCSSSEITITATLYPKLPYNALKDLTPVVLVARAPVLLTVNPSVPVRSVRDLLDLARAKPSELTFGSSGTGATTHLSLELFKYLGKVNITHVPYKGGSQSVLGVLSGQIQGVFSSPSSVLPHYKTGKLRGVAVSTANRSEFAPDLPTIAESGLPGYEVSVWYGLFAQRAVPLRIVDRLNSEVNRMLNLPETKEFLFANGISAIGGTHRSGCVLY